MTMAEKLIRRDIDEEIRHTFMAFDMQCNYLYYLSNDVASGSDNNTMH